MVVLLVLMAVGANVHMYMVTCCVCVCGRERECVFVYVYCRYPYITLHAKQVFCTFLGIFCTKKLNTVLFTLIITSHTV